MQESQLAILYLVKFSDTYWNWTKVLPLCFGRSLNYVSSPAKRTRKFTRDPLSGWCWWLGGGAPLATPPPTLSPRTHLYAACCKLNANRRLGLQIEFIARETWEQITFTNTGVTDKDNCKGLESISDGDAGDIDIGIG